MRIFVSHRRRSMPLVTLLEERLQQRFGRHSVMVESPPAAVRTTKRKASGSKRRKGRGVNKPKRIRVEQRRGQAAAEKVQHAQAVLVFIDQGWSKALHAPQDGVRAQLEEAFRRELPVVPVLLGGATMPDVDDLPPSLHPLAEIPGLPLSAGDGFQLQSQRIVHALTDGAERRIRWRAKERAAHTALAQAQAAQVPMVGRRAWRLGLVAAAVILGVGLPAWWMVGGHLVP